MNPKLPVLITLLGLLAGSPRLAAQSAKPPGPTDYDAFSRFVTDRNIFDPNRQSHNYGTPRVHVSRHHTQLSTPTFTFSGALSYEKGLFAFFNANTPDYRQVLSVNQTIAGYTVTSLTLTNVVLVSADKKDRQTLQVGDTMRQDGDKWEFVAVADQSGLSTPSATDNSGSTSSSPGNDSGAATPTLSPNNAPNDILKRLMEQRQKESQ